VNAVVKEGGNNALTRERLLQAASEINGFTAEGMIGRTDVGDRVQSDCFVVLQVKGGAFTPEQLARHAAGHGMTAVAMTDRDGLYGAARFVDACEREGVRPILGASLTVREPGTLPLPRSGRRSVDASVVLLARDTTGYANLCRLVTDAHMTGERGDPSLTPEQLCAHAEGLVALLGPSPPPGARPLAVRSAARRPAPDPYRQPSGEPASPAVRPG